MPHLLEQTHDLVDHTIKNGVVGILDIRATHLGMRVEGSKLTGRIFVDQVSPVATAASSGRRTGYL